MQSDYFVKFKLELAIDRQTRSVPTIVNFLPKNFFLGSLKFYNFKSSACIVWFMPSKL